jgi:hypothetical protein
MQRVIIESPYAGQIERNVRYARLALRDSLLRGEAPYASHLLYTQPGVLRDEMPPERTNGIEAGQAWMEVADLVAVYADHGVTDGMRAGIEAAAKKGVPVVYRTLVEAKLED